MTKNVFSALLACSLAVSALADEGMWLFNQPPRQILKDRHQFEPTDAWMEHLQKSSVRFNSGGSGSFVSEGNRGQCAFPFIFVLRDFVWSD